MSEGLGSASGPCCRDRGGVREPERRAPARRAPVRRSVWVPALGGASGGPGCSPRPLSSRLLRGTGCPRTGQSCRVRGHSPDPGALCAPRWRPLPDPLAELNNCIQGEALQTMLNWKRRQKARCVDSEDEMLEVLKFSTKHGRDTLHRSQRPPDSPRAAPPVGAHAHPAPSRTCRLLGARPRGKLVGSILPPLLEKSRKGPG